jgi:diguanylate cyclase (GGDEF)-like protein/PAS domain S-box-containing protein
MLAPAAPPDPEEQRLQALLGYRVLDTEAERAIDDLTTLAAAFLGTPMALVSLLDRDRQWFKSRVGVDTAETPRCIAFCDHTIRGAGVLVVNDARQDPRFADNPLVTGAPHIRFYAGAPLRTPQGHAVGTLCVLDSRPRSFDAAQADSLAALARQVVAQFELRLHNHALSEAGQRLRDERDRLQALQTRLALSETRMALVLKGANDGWWDWDLVSGQRYHSPRGWAMLGYGDAELPYDGALWDRLVHPEDIPRIARLVADTLRSQASHYSAEMRLRHKDGHDVPVLSRGYILRDPDSGRALRLSGTNTDLSERRQAERALLAEQQLNRQIVESAPVGIAIYDAVGDCITANPSMARHIGADVSALQAQNMHRIASWKASGIYPLALQTLRSGTPTSAVIQQRTSFGREVWLAVSFVALGPDGQGRLMLMASDLTDIKRAEQQRLATQRSHEMLFANSLDGVLQTRPGGAVLAANPAACAMLGLSEQALRGCDHDTLLDTSDPRLAAMLQERARSGRARGELRMRRGNGELFEAEVASLVYRDGDGQPIAAAVFRDITERHRWRQRLQDSLTLLDNLAQHVPGLIYQYRVQPDGHAHFPFASPAIRQIYELSAEQVHDDASLVFERLHPDDRAAVAAAIDASAATLQPWHQEFRVVLPQQGLRWRQGDAVPERLADGSVLWHGFITDISARKQAEAHTHQLAYFDALTGLPNRRLLTDRIAHALSAAQRSAQMGALLFIDLDDFKKINDARGHAVGDQLLKQVAARLSQLLRGDDSVARLGGDEFVVLVGQLGPDAESAARHARAVADRVRALLETPYDIDGALYDSAGSVGITLFPKGHEHVDDLLREADTAMYRAKAAGRNRIAFFEPAMQAEVEQRLALEQDLREAVGSAQITAFVQPQVDSHGREVGAELLLRWQHPRRGSVSPAQFIPVAEQTGLILPLGEFVILQACEALVRLRAAGQRLALSVNVSPRQFRKDDFVARVRALLAQTGAPADQLVFEVTEGLLIDDWEGALARMSELVALGIRFSIDDFGTGYSSLSYLKKMPLYELKIDRSFVRDTPADPNDTAIVQLILSMGRDLGLRVVAEGVETQAQADFLVAGGCPAMQGFLFARPQPLAAWLEGREAVLFR